MEPLRPGHFWKTPFIWEPGCQEPQSVAAVCFEEAPDAWLNSALAQVMSHSLDESDQYTVQHSGPDHAVTELLAIVPLYFEKPEAWWRVAVDAQGQKVGFVLPVLFKDQARWNEGRPQGTILYMGVLPEFRGRGYARALLDEATRICIQARCWRIFCDTSSSNAPMLNAFRQAGYKERSSWQRPIA
jgi:ribosomal protein S18 acetylase RimI-like enzyme